MPASGLGGKPNDPNVLNRQKAKAFHLHFKHGLLAATFEFRRAGWEDEKLNADLSCPKTPLHAGLKLPPCPLGCGTWLV